MMKTMIKSVIAVALLATLTACGTAQGVASDAWDATKFVARQIGNNN